MSAEKTETALVTSVSKGPTTNKDVEGEALKALARTIGEGEVMSWQAMMEATKRDMKRVRAVWNKVRSDLVGEGYVFRSVASVGYRRCMPEQALEKVDGRMQNIRRTAHAALRENRTVDRRRLAPEMAAHADTQAIVLTMLESKADEVKPQRVAPSSQPGVPLAALADSIAQMK